MGPATVVVADVLSCNWHPDQQVALGAGLGWAMLCKLGYHDGYGVDTDLLLSVLFSRGAMAMGTICHHDRLCHWLCHCVCLVVAGWWVVRSPPG
jgi:hypothetical protein